MKKIGIIGILVFSCFLFVFSTACSGIGMEPEINVNVDSSAKVEFDEKKYECNIKRTPEGLGVVTLTKPEILEGLNFSWQNGEYELSMKDLSGSFNKEILPKESFALCIMQVLSNASIKENIKCNGRDDEGFIFEGACEAGKYKITTDSDGCIKKIDIQEKRIIAEF